MLSVETASQPKLARPELHPLRPTQPAFNPAPSPRPNTAIVGEGLDQWFQDLQKYEDTLVCIPLFYPNNL